MTHYFRKDSIVETKQTCIIFALYLINVLGLAYSSIEYLSVAY